MDRIFCVEDDSKDNPGYFPGYLTVVLKRWKDFVKDQRYEMGTRQNPLNLEAVNRKLLDNLSPYYSEERIRRSPGFRANGTAAGCRYSYPGFETR